MSEAVREQKAALRSRLRKELKLLSPTARLVASGLACSLLQEKRIWREARSVLLYAALADEPDVGALWRDALLTGKTLALPRFDPHTQCYQARRVLDMTEDLRPGQFGISEPKETCSLIALNELDLALAPGVAFALDGRRLGRGKGFYDRLLSSVRGVKCGIAFDEQIVDAIPAEPHDMCVDYILTPTRWRRGDQSVVLK